MQSLSQPALSAILVEVRHSAVRYVQWFNHPMPVTFFAHQAPVLPLKIWKPQWLNGTALVVGSMTPDFEYFLRTGPPWYYGHTLLAQFTLCLPEALVVMWLIRTVIAEPLAAHLPDLGAFHLKDYGTLAFRRPIGYWLAAIPCALLGSFSHVIWDGFTHGNGWGTREVGYSQRIVMFFPMTRPIPLWEVLQHSSTLAGALVTVALLRRIGRDRLLIRWNGGKNPVLLPPTRASVFALWGAVAVGAAAGFADAKLLSRALAGQQGFHESLLLVFRTVLGAFIGLCVGCLAAGRLTSSTRPGRSAAQKG